MAEGSAIFAERWVESAGARLRALSARVEGPVRAEVLLTHGLGEHSRRYELVAARMAEAGLRLHVYDLRGHGRSDGPRGDAVRYEDLLEDLEEVRRSLAPEGRPLFLMGHSFGGQLTLNFLLTRAVACRGAVIASPLLRLAFAPPWWKILLGRLALRVWPGKLYGRPIKAADLSSDLAYLRALPFPELSHDRISARLFFALRARGEWALEHAGELRVPVLLLHGGADEVTSAGATRLFYERAGSADKRFFEVPSGRHELHNDLGRAEVLREVVEWMGARCADD